ncbi:unnamed protein product, partial [Mesorhabditis spiculigera]
MPRASWEDACALDAYLELQSDYYEVYDAACDMVTHLEKTVRGEKPSPSLVAEFRQKVNTTNEEAEKKMTRKGVTPRRGRSLTDRTVRSTLRKCESLTNVPSDPHSPPRDPGPSPPTVPLVSELALHKIVTIVAQSPQSRQAALILQALRQQISVASCKGYAKKTVELFAERDILFLKTRRNSLPSVIFLGSESNGIESREQLARFVNAIASFKVGRDYLLSISQGKELITQILGCLRTKRIHSHTQDNLLAVLQKLSIRASVQKELLQLGGLDWLLPLLEGRLSGYAQEFGAALLMNLCMCQPGQPTLLKFIEPILQTLKSLSRMNNPAMCPYLNGSIYGLMALGRARSRARDMGLEPVLQAKLDRSDCTLDEFQLPFLMRQIRGEVEMMRIPLPPTDEEDTAGDNLESDISASDTLRSSGSELSGARLLIAKGRKEEPKMQEEINVPGTVPQKHPNQTRITKKDASIRRNRSRTVTFEGSRSEPRLATTASQATFIIEHDRRKPCVVAVGLTEAALQYRHQQKEKENAELEKRRLEAKAEEDKRKEEERKREEERLREEAKNRPKDPRDLRKKVDSGRPRNSPPKTEIPHHHHHHEGRECKRHSIHQEEKSKPAMKSARSIAVESKREAEPKIVESPKKKEDRSPKAESPLPAKENVNVAGVEKERTKERKKPSPIAIPIDEIVPEAAPVSDKIPKRIPEDANAYEYISVFGARPKVPRTPEKDKKPTNSVLLY